MRGAAFELPLARSCSAPAPSRSSARPSAMKRTGDLDVLGGLSAQVRVRGLDALKHAGDLARGGVHLGHGKDGRALERLGRLDVLLEQLLGVGARRQSHGVVIASRAAAALHMCFAGGCRSGSWMGRCAPAPLACWIAGSGGQDSSGWWLLQQPALCAALPPSACAAPLPLLKGRAERVTGGGPRRALPLRVPPHSRRRRTLGSRKDEPRYDGTTKSPENESRVPLASSCLMVKRNATRSPPGSCTVTGA